MLEVIEAFLTPNKWSRPQIAIKPVRGIVMHYVENPGTSAMFNRNYFESRKKGKLGFGSAHFIVDLTGIVILCIPPNEVAYHCGESKQQGYVYTAFALQKFGVWPNACTLGVEMCHLDREGRFTDDTIRAAAKLISCLCERHDLDPINDVVRHYDITSKPCPLWWVQNPLAFEAFKNSAKHEMIAEECHGENGG
jgi:N-acetylmuramoyl-L-alanine amidase